MNPANQTSRCVLFVDDDQAFLEIIKELMASCSDGRWEVLTAHSSSQALAALQARAVDLVAIDVQMPVMDGIQMLSLLNRGYPTLQKVVLTGFANEKYRVACLSNGAELFLEKPKSREELQSLYATLNELMKWGKPKGFQGVMRRVGLAEIIQVECTEGNSSVLEVKSEATSGRIFIRAGAMIHATVGEQKGSEALGFLLALRGGDFKLSPFAEPPEQTLNGTWEELLLRATPSREPAGNLKKTEEVPSAPTSREHSSPAAIAIPADAAVGPVVTGRPHVDEILMCSAQGEVLYEWQCRELDQWVKFLEFVSQKAQRLAQGVGLGDFDRLEIFQEHSRIVVIIGPDRGVMIRTKRGLVSGTDGNSGPTGSQRATASDEVKEQLAGWLRSAPSARGVLVRGIRFPDETMTCDLDSRDFPVVALEQSVRSVADTYQVLIAHQLAPLRLVWIYSRASLHCARRKDNTILAAVTLTKPGETDLAGVDCLLSGFSRLNAAGG